MGCRFCLQQFIPRTRVRLHAMDGGLDLVSHIVVAYPHHSITCLAIQVQQANDIPGSQIGLNPGQESSIEADVANLRFLQEALTSGINSPDSHCKIRVGTGFTAAVKLTKDSHNSLFTVSSSFRGVKITQLGYPGENCRRVPRWEHVRNGSRKRREN